MAAVVNMIASDRPDLLKDVTGDNHERKGDNHERKGDNHERKGDNHVGIFRFNVDMNKLGHNYFSDDKYSVGGLHFSCSVKRFQSGEFQVGLELLRNDNPLLKSCVLDYRVALFNTNTAKYTTLSYESHRTLRVGRNYVGLENVLQWNDLIDRRQGFVDANDKFIIVLEIKEMRDIKSDLMVIVIILLMMIFMLIVMTLMYGIQLE